MTRAYAAAVPYLEAAAADEKSKQTGPETANLKRTAEQALRPIQEFQDSPKNQTLQTFMMALNHLGWLDAVIKFKNP
jgi:hypothetical protein